MNMLISSHINTLEKSSEVSDYKTNKEKKISSVNTKFAPTWNNFKNSSKSIDDIYFHGI